MSSAGVGPLCFLKSTVNAAIYQEILEHCMLPSADKLYGDADFIFQQDLAPAHTAKGTKSWFNDHGVTVLDWPANSPDLNPIENLWGIVKRKMRDTRPNNADELKATVKETWASIPPQQCHKLITSMPRWIEAVIKAKGAPTKYWVQSMWAERGASAKRSVRNIARSAERDFIQRPERSLCLAPVPLQYRSHHEPRACTNPPRIHLCLQQLTKLSAYTSKIVRCEGEMEFVKYFQKQTDRSIQVHNSCQKK